MASHHSIRHIRKPHATRKLHDSIFYKTDAEVIANQSFFYIAGMGIFALFAPVT